MLDDLATLRRGLDDLPDGSARNARELLEVATQTWGDVADIVDNLQIAGVLHFDPANRARAQRDQEREVQPDDGASAFPKELFERLLLRYVRENFSEEDIGKAKDGISVCIHDDHGGECKTVLRFDLATALGIGPEPAAADEPETAGKISPARAG